MGYGFDQDFARFEEKQKQRLTTEINSLVSRGVPKSLAQHWPTGELETDLPRHKLAQPINVMSSNDVYETYEHTDLSLREFK